MAGWSCDTLVATTELVSQEGGGPSPSDLDALIQELRPQTRELS